MSETVSATDAAREGRDEVTQAIPQHSTLTPEHYTPPEFIEAARPEILLRGSDLYVRLGDSFTVLAVTGAGRFKGLRAPKPKP